MPPRLNLFTARNVAPILHQRPAQSGSLNLVLRPNPRVGLGARHNSNSSRAPEDEENAPKGPTQDPLPHVSEEAAQMEKIMSGKKCDGAPASPELEQGTPISEILERDEEARKHMPKVMQDQMKKSNPSSSSGNPSGTRGFSTSVRAGQEMQQPPQHRDGDAESVPDPDAVLVADMISKINGQATALHGLKFPTPESLPPTENFRTRYDSILKSFTNMLMRDGKKARAQRNMSIILDYLRTSPPPTINPNRRLLPGGPPAAQLPLNPVQYLNLVVASVAPVIAVKNFKGMAGGGRALPVPAPLGPGDRRRTAIRWIIDASDKRRDSQLANRVAQEIIAVAEGRSSVWDRRENVHKNGTAARANGDMLAMRRRMMGMSMNK